ncbi:glycoside hydrolase family 36 protein [Dictyobacter aurantiacus]|uniref:Alpha-galactosidase n=1 Tax=Dictyobacter aurantiacus TaxID=1936993 RepID=A0A401ZPJ5_9CHLR|nr:glycoside hydrolase family 36 protein [Dictyobacter aurantiacus]GCE08783.1 hypothetical protein KDAU_61120 [Dictyobacter aurantiacus]
MTTISGVASTISITGMGDNFSAQQTVTEVNAGLSLIELHITANDGQARPAPRIQISWSLPMHDIYSLWHSGSDRNKNIPADWSHGNIAKVTSQMPVVSFYSYHGENRLTAAFSDALEAVEIKAGVSEETGELHCSLNLFVESSPELADYMATLRLDTRAIPYYTALDNVQRWWAEQPGYEPAPVPEPARLPMYSTWYSFHQQLEPAAIEAQCRIAKELGCEAVIVDDGWQTINNERGYAYCGDWEVATEKIPDMKAHVARVHELGMKYVLWYSVPFVGQYSKAWSRFNDRMLYTIERLGAGVLDPRYPEVREYLIQLYEKALVEWDLDGFKLDFVDAFRAEPRFPQPPLSSTSQVSTAEERDEQSIDRAVDRLLTDIMVRLRAIKPDILIEFRQSYVGPLMRKYGNMFRAGDCPYEFITNRVRTLDIRLLCGQTAAHADMLMWHPDEPAEIVAQQLINVLFSVPQISVLLDKLPATHLEVVRYWLAFWRQHRDVLLDGTLMPAHPEVLYPMVSATNEDKYLIVSYQDNIITLPDSIPEELIVINGSLEQRLVLEVTADSGSRQMHIRDCRGQSIQQAELTLNPGLHMLNVPASGTVTLQKH